jgi:hypothetical protein
MVTPMCAYRDAAERWGNVDRNDEKAVYDFFTFRFPNLSEQRKNEIVMYLESREGQPDTDPPRPRKRPTTPPVDGINKVSHESRGEASIPSGDSGGDGATG